MPPGGRQAKVALRNALALRPTSSKLQGSSGECLSQLSCCPPLISRQRQLHANVHRIVGVKWDATPTMASFEMASDMAYTTAFHQKDPLKPAGEQPEPAFPVACHLSTESLTPRHCRYDMNRLNSPLLRLPFELRLQIYRNVLGDRQIHIFFVPWQHKQRIKNGQAYTETIKGEFRYEVLEKRQDPWKVDRRDLRKQHPRDLINPRGPTVAAAAADDDDTPQITLLSGVCRQLYLETALLPHQLNTWSFETMNVMERYILKENRMPLMQRRAVQMLYCKERLSKALEKKFGGLKVIIWKDGKKLRWQDLSLFPEVAWKDRQELRERTWRW
jgi:hypothetical protein